MALASNVLRILSKKPPLTPLGDVLESRLLVQTFILRSPSNLSQFLLCSISSFPSVMGFVGNSEGITLPVHQGSRFRPDPPSARFIRSPPDHKYILGYEGLSSEDRPDQEERRRIPVKNAFRKGLVLAVEAGINLVIRHINQRRKRRDSFSFRHYSAGNPLHPFAGRLDPRRYTGSRMDR